MRLCSLVVVSACLLFADALTAQDKPAEKTTYKDHVLPIFRAKCGSCHNGNDRKGGLVLDDYGTMMQGGSSGNVVEPGDLGTSYLWDLVNHTSEPKMPPNGKLPDEELAVIKKWIEGGLLENSGSVAKASAKPSLAKVEIKPGQRPAEVAMPGGWLGDPAVSAERPNAVTGLAVSPWAPLAAVSGHRQISLYNSQTLAPLGVLPYPEGQPQLLRFSPLGDLLIVGGGRSGAAGNVVVFDVKTGERKIECGAEYDTVLAADLSPDQTLVALGGPKRLVRIFSTATGEQLHEIKKHTDWVTSVAFSPDGVLLATGDRANGLVVWESDTGRIFYDLLGHKGAITDVAWRTDGNVLASASEDGTIKLWDMNNGTQIKSWDAHGGGVASLDYTADGKLVSVGRDKVAKLWQGDGAKIRDLAGLGDIGMEVAFDNESKRVLAGDWTGTIVVWNAEDGKELGRINTNPPTLAARLDEVARSLAQAEAELKAKADQQAALQKQAADRQAAAEQAAKQLVAVAEKSRQAAEATKQAQAALQQQQTALDAAAAQAKQAETAAADTQQTVGKASDALQQAEAALAQAKAAFDKAAQDRDAAQAALAAAQQAQQAAKEGQGKAQTAVTAATTALQQAQAAEKAAIDSAAAAKAAADKAQAAATPTDEQQKALDQAAQEARAAQLRLDQIKSQLDQLKAQQTAAPAKAG
jgi:WD40 repeat protein